MRFEDLSEHYEDFVSARDWTRFHTPQNLAQAISIESNELLENFLWMNNPSAQEVKEDEELLQETRDEMADVMIYLIGLANRLDIDLLKAVEEKMDTNEERFDADEVQDINEYLDEWQ